MKYPNIASILNWEETPELSEGIHLQPEEAAAIDTAIGNSTVAIGQATEAADLAYSRIQELELQVTTARDALTQEQTARETAEHSLATANARITELEAEGPAGTAGTVKELDEQEAPKVKAMEMPFQKELMQKHGL